MIIDTGVVIAAQDERDVHHLEAALFLAGTRERLVMPAPVLFETAQFVGRKRRAFAEAQCLRKGSLLGVENPVVDDYERAAALIERYSDQDGGRGIGVVDALVVAMAERLKETKVATYDRRHFSVIRPSHVDAFELFP